MTEAIQNALQAAPWAGLLLVVLLAWLEYVFPPAPGDSTMLFACFLAANGALPLPAVLAACLGGSVLGAATAYAIGARLGRAYFFLRSEWARAELLRLEHAFGRYGPRLLAVNRFLPGLRGLFLYGAGIGRLGWRPVMIYSTLSNVLWILLIAWAGTSLGESWEEVWQAFRRYVWIIGIGTAAYVAASIIRMRRRRRAERRAARTGSSSSATATRFASRPPDGPAGPA
jgi:membrane protein DedA with SNARE-associated domain